MTSAADKSLGNEVVKNLVLKVNKDDEVKTGCREVPEDAGQSRIRILGLLSPEYPCKETSATLEQQSRTGTQGNQPTARSFGTERKGEQRHWPSEKKAP